MYSLFDAIKDTLEARKQGSIISLIEGKIRDATKKGLTRINLVIEVSNDDPDVVRLLIIKYFEEQKYEVNYNKIDSTKFNISIGWI